MVEMFEHEMGCGMCLSWVGSLTKHGYCQREVRKPAYSFRAHGVVGGLPLGMSRLAKDAKMILPEQDRFQKYLNTLNK